MLWIMKRAARCGQLGGASMIPEAWRRGKKWKKAPGLTPHLGHHYNSNAFARGGGQGEEDIPAEPAPALEGARLPPAHEDEERTRGSARTPAQGAQASLRLGDPGGEAAPAGCSAVGIRSRNALCEPPPRPLRLRRGTRSAALCVRGRQETRRRGAAQSAETADARGVPSGEKGVLARMRSGAAGQAGNERGLLCGPLLGAAGSSAEGGGRATSVGALTLLALVHFYRHVISPLTGPHCRYTPTCSQYALTAIERYGARKGGAMAVKRLLRCHPFHPGGWDPVP